MTVALAPIRNGKLESGLSMLIFIGKRCVTLTQLPLAFSGGNNLKLVPLPLLMLTTFPVKVRLGYISTFIFTG